MGSEVGPAEIIGQLTRTLESAGVPYMLTGSLASALHGMPRSTQDIDVVIAPSRASLDRLIGQFPRERYYVDRDTALQAYEDATQFNVVDRQTGWKVDFIIRKPRRFSRTEFERRVEADTLGTRVFVATAEDVLISKLEWAKLGESDRQIRDAAGIIRTQADELDVAYVEYWVNELSLEAQWAVSKAMANQP